MVPLAVSQHFSLYTFVRLIIDMSPKLRAALISLLSACLAACSLSDGGRTLTLIPNPIGAIAYTVEKHRIRGPDEPWTLFTDVNSERETSLVAGFYQLCKELSFNKSEIIPVSGFRLLKTNPLTTFSARGYPSPIDFYSSFSSRKARANSTVEAIQVAIAVERLPFFLEFQDKAGAWKRSSFDSSLGTIATVDASDLRASHGIVFTQIPTGHENQYSIFGVEISVIDLTTNKVIARNVGLVSDTYLGAHNRFSLIPNSNRCGYPVEENFVGSWLVSLARPNPVGSIDPYDGYTKRVMVTDENRHWADSK